ncbi:MAG: hypothetical protein V1874_09930 [Spirochaetota bacterium]
MKKSNFEISSISEKNSKIKDALYLNPNRSTDKINHRLAINPLSLTLGRKKCNAAVCDSRHLLINKIDRDFHGAINNSIIMRFSRIALQNVDKNSSNKNLKYILNEEFCHCCLNHSLSAFLFNKYNDEELILLYIKQFILILKNTDTTNLLNEFITVKDLAYMNIQLFFMLLNSFWNKSKWRELFPSMPEAADVLQKNKNLLIDLMLSKHGQFRIDKISNTFFKKIKFYCTGDLLLSSFLDFSIFTWLSHFNMLNYCKGNINDPVMVELTKHGRKTLENLIS